MKRLTIALAVLISLIIITQTTFAENAEDWHKKGNKFFKSKEYKKAIDFADNPPEDAEILHLIPPPTFRSKRTTTNLKILQADYQLGFDQGKLAIEQFNSLCGPT